MQHRSSAVEAAFPVPPSSFRPVARQSGAVGRGRSRTHSGHPAGPSRLPANTDRQRRHALRGQAQADHYAPGVSETLVAYSGKRALAAVCRYCPAVAIVDLKLCDMTGATSAHPAQPRHPAGARNSADRRRRAFGVRSRASWRAQPASSACSKPVPSWLLNRLLLRGLKWPAALLRYAICMYDLSRNNVRVTGRGPSHSFWRTGTAATRTCGASSLRHSSATSGSSRSTTSGMAVRMPRLFDRDRHATLEGYAADVLQICRALAVRDAVFVGHSVSAMIGIIAARKAPHRFESLILIGPSPCYINDAAYHGGFTRADIDSCWSCSIRTTSAGPPTWGRRSWATPRGPSSAPSSPTVSAAPIPTSRDISLE